MTDAIDNARGVKGETDMEPRPVKQLPRRIRYDVPLTPAEVLERLGEEPSLGVYTKDDLPDWADLGARHRFTAEVDGDRFRLHTGAPAARGQSGTGLLRLLYLAGTSTRIPGGGTGVELRFVYSRPRWAGQRRLGLVTLLIAAAFWVSVGGGEMFDRLLFFTAFVAVTTPVVIHDLRRGRRLREEKIELLALAERIFGPLAVETDGTPYRRGD